MQVMFMNRDRKRYVIVNVSPPLPQYVNFNNNIYIWGDGMYIKLPKNMATAREVHLASHYISTEGRKLCWLEVV